MAFVLIADKLSEVNDRLVESPHVATIEIPLPDEAQRERFVQFNNREQKVENLVDLGGANIAEVSSGLSLTSLNVVLTQAARSGKKVDSARFKQLKKSMIERQCQGLIEFIEPATRSIWSWATAPPSSGCTKTPRGSPKASSTPLPWAI